MLDWMRKIAPGMMVIVILAFVSTIFFAWGMNASALKDMKKDIGKIGNKKISIEQYSSAYKNEEQQQGKKVQTPTEQLNFPLRVWENLVSSEILTGVVKDMGIAATVDETYNYLLDNPPPSFTQNEYFFTDGKFDKTKYEKFLNNPQSYDIPGVVQMELYTRNVIVPLAKLQTLLNAGKNPSRSEIEEEYRAINDKAQFEYLMISPIHIYGKVSVNDEQIKSYYDAHKSDYKSGSKVSLNYVRLSKDATSKDEVSIQKDLLAIADSVRAGKATFEEEAKMESDDEGSAVNGGELGWFKKGTMVPIFDQTAFSLDSGEISAPVKSKFGYHLIYVEGKKLNDSGEVVEVKARHILKKIVPTLESLDSLDNLVGELKSLADEVGLDSASKKLGVVMFTTPLFGKGEAAKGIGYFNGLGRFSFDAEAKIGDISDPFDNSQGFYLVSIKDKFKGGILPVEMVRSEIEAKVKDSLMIAFAKDYLTKVTPKLSDTITFEEFAKTDEILTGGITDTTVRKKFITGIGYNNGVTAAAFATAKGKISKPVTADNGVYIVRPLYKDIAKEVPTEGIDIERVAKALKITATKNSYVEWYAAYKKNLNVTENVRKYYY